ncbi:MAG: S9 family peptidase, partial [Planctomycetes bacterium]|nr:S9 family peptidase [Planctomycetota bacterium]
MTRKFFMIVALLTGLCAVLYSTATAIAGERSIKYPETKRVNHVDDYHGTKVPDPYRWLETDVRESKEVADWVAAQNKVTFEYLKSLPKHEEIEKRLTELWDFEKYGSPFKAGGRYYYYHNSGLQNQSVLYTQNALDDKPRVLMDPNTWSQDGTVALAGTAFSDNGKYVAYGIQDAGSDWHTWRIMEIESGTILEDELKWVKFSGMSWTKDSSTLYYSRYDEPEQGAAFQSLNLNQKVYSHRVGTPQSEDVLVYQRPDHPDWGFDATVTEDGRYLVITVWKGTDDKFRILYQDLSQPKSEPVDLIDNFDNEYSFVGNDGTTFYFKTDLQAPRRRLISIDLNKPNQKNWKEIIPQTQETLRSVSFVSDLFVASYLKDAKTQVKIHAMHGKFVREVEFPGIGSASGFSGKRKHTETFYSFSSFATPPSVYHYDMLTGKSKLIRQSNVKFQPDEYEVKQIFYTSKDGTRVPMFLSHKKGIKLDGSNPTLLYGYGGFNIPLTPRFSISRLAWMEMGGVYAQANLRGGGEYGEEWHKAGTKLNKQNVFDDFIAAAAPISRMLQGKPQRGILPPPKRDLGVLGFAAYSLSVDGLQRRGTTDTDQPSGTFGANDLALAFS